jgi:hypothetical protein
VTGAKPESNNAEASCLFHTQTLNNIYADKRIIQYKIPNMAKLNPVLAPIGDDHEVDPLKARNKNYFTQSFPCRERNSA